MLLEEGLHSQCNYTVIRCWGGFFLILQLFCGGATIEFGPRGFCSGGSWRWNTQQVVTRAPNNDVTAVAPHSRGVKEQHKTACWLSRPHHPLPNYSPSITWIRSSSAIITVMHQTLMTCSNNVVSALREPVEALLLLPIHLKNTQTH